MSTSTKLGRRFLLVRDRTGRVRHQIDTTWCQHCADTFVCALCGSRAERARAGIQRCDERRALGTAAGRE